MWPAVANRAWQAANLRRDANFRAALRDPAKAQRQLLLSTLRRNSSTAFGREHGFDQIDSLQSFRDHVALQTYDDVQPWIERIMRGERGVLTHDKVARLIPTSGTTGGCKLIPYTCRLQRQFNAAIGPWIVNLFRQRPALRNGSAYWSISPAMPIAVDTTCALSIGFDDDTAYLGRLSGWLARRTIAVPSHVRSISDFDDFRYMTLWHLLQSRDLVLVSVWHPSFWTLLLDGLEMWWDRLRDDVAQGACNPPSKQDAKSVVRRARKRSDLSNVGPSDYHAIWPRLEMISAWGDAAAAMPFDALRKDWPDVTLQRKGLLSTEAFVSLPYDEHHPLAITSHVLEFIDDHGVCHDASALDRGGVYEVVVTTAGGLYRYRTGDRVEVTGRVEQTSSIRFVGRLDDVTDVCGEKLSEHHVAAVLHDTFSSMKVSPRYAMLAPARAAAPTHYRLYVSSDCNGNTAGLASTVDEALQSNPHYAYARRLGQLGPVQCVTVASDHVHAVLHEAHRAGHVIGSVKPIVLGKAPR